MSGRPDKFVDLIRSARRGRHKIYLGYCAGVGKTCQMLKEALRLRDVEKLDVVIGFLETHGRAETAACRGDLEEVPPRKIVHRGLEIAELDLTAILALRPQVVLVDELAHANAPGSGKPKRYLEVEELLEAGIHVISTLNIQHLESLYETVERNTGVKIKERIPDWVLNRADEVVNVDVSTADLRERIRSGRVWPEERISAALENFYEDGKLRQLRELTLRELAAQLDLKFREETEPAGREERANPDQVLVCLSSRSPNADALLRYGSRLAGRLNRNWYVLYVQTSGESAARIDVDTQRRLADTLELARQVGATVFTFRSDHIVETILQFARELRVGHIVIGPSDRRFSWFDRLLGKTTLLEQLTLANHDFKIVITENREPAGDSGRGGPQ